MQDSFFNKMQTADKKPAAVCSVCKGKKKVKSADGATMVSCQMCRGTGISGGYSTKDSISP